MSTLHTDLKRLHADLTALRAKHAAEIERTVHTVYSASGYATGFKLSSGLDAVADNLADALDTYQLTNNIAGDELPDDYERQHRLTAQQLGVGRFA